MIVPLLTHWPMKFVPEDVMVCEVWSESCRNDLGIPLTVSEILVNCMGCQEL